MTADTEKYITLQQMLDLYGIENTVFFSFCYDYVYYSYHKQAAADVEAVWRRTLQLLRQLGKPSDSISERDVKLFCRHASNIHVERGTRIADEYDSKTFDASNIGNI